MSKADDLGEGYAYWKCEECDVTGKDDIVNGTIACWSCGRPVTFTKYVSYGKFPR